MKPIRQINSFSDAIRLDPNYALAYAGISDSYADLGFDDYRPPAEVFPKAKAAALKAIELDPQIADGHTALATVSWAYDWDWSAAEHEFRRGLELNPSSSLGNLRYAMYSANLGKFPEAFRAGDRTLEIDPVCAYCFSIVGYAHCLAHDYDRAAQFFQKSLAMDPGPLALAELAWTYAFQGKFREALAEYAKYPKPPDLAEDQLVAGGLGYVYAVAGERRQALELLARFTQLAKTQYVDPYMVAAIYAGLGDKDSAFTQLNKAFSERSASMVFLKFDPFFDSLHSDPRFQELLQRMGFPG
jgi:tetratricopeptide (TPR) repeat protein